MNLTKKIKAWLLMTKRGRAIDKAREEVIREILAKIDKDYKGRDITIYELSDWLKKVATLKK